MYNANEIKLTKEEEELALDDTWGCLFGHTRKIHGNENRIWNNCFIMMFLSIKVEIILIN